MHGFTCVNIIVLYGWSDESIREIKPQMEFKSVTQIARDANPQPNTQTIFIGINFHHFWLIEVANFKSSLRHPIFI